MSTATVHIRAGEIMKRLNGSAVGAEIGVFAGALSRHLLKRHGLFLYMVDPWRGDHPQRYIDAGDYHAKLNAEQQEAFYKTAKTATEFASNRRQIVRLPSVEAAEMFKDGTLDFVFLDGEHTYEGCSEDIEAWWPKIKPKGWLSGHDYDDPAHPEYGVKRAVIDASNRHGWRYEVGGDFTWFVQL